MNLGWTEILLLGAIAMLVFGPSRLPNLGRSLGESIRGCKKALNEDPSEEQEVNKQITQNQNRALNQEQKQEQKDPHGQS
jgi:sec-independent protein translocase protein TatA